MATPQSPSPEHEPGTTQTQPTPEGMPVFVLTPELVTDLAILQAAKNRQKPGKAPEPRPLTEPTDLAPSAERILHGTDTSSFAPSAARILEEEFGIGDARLATGTTGPHRGGSLYNRLHGGTPPTRPHPQAPQSPQNNPNTAPNYIGMDVFGDLAFGGIRRAVERFRQRRPEKKFERLDRIDDFYFELGRTARAAVSGAEAPDFDPIKPRSLWQRRQKSEVEKATRKAAPARVTYSQMAAANKRLDPENRKVLAEAKEEFRIGKITKAEYDRVKDDVESRYENWGTSDTKPVRRAIGEYAKGTKKIRRITTDEGRLTRIREKRLEKAETKVDEAPDKARERYQKRVEKVRRKQARKRARQNKRTARQQNQNQQPPTNP